ncbi:hypothetical protein [uncultured Clostridium sp.]|uniref:hypothetical protein n=1 Tax=uncultured Clostridium sp. TaxID=59620 RepID=UPI0025E584B4|nr:hypothetical protein [uncultured Clostridium sp.]
MTFNNIKEDIEIWMEYRITNLITFKIFMAIVYLALVLTPILVNKDLFIGNRSTDYNIATISIDLVIIVVEILIALYIIYNLIPKLIKYLIREESKKLLRKKKIFYCEKKVTINENYIEVYYDNKEFKISNKNSIKTSEFRGRIFFIKTIGKNIISEVYPVIIPVEKFKNSIK